MAFLIFQSDKILVFATETTTNRKVGGGTQIWVMDATMHPVQSRQTGNDAKTCCGGCELASNNGCYVFPFPMSAIYKSYIEGSIPFIKPGSSEWTRLFVNQFVRFGAYGNPSMIPFSLLERIAKDSRKYTGYFHDWHLMEPGEARQYGQYLMASCNINNYKRAQDLGLRTYTVSSTLVPGSVECLFKTKKLTCIECSLCDGVKKNKKKNVWISPGGFQLKKAIKATMAA